MEGMSERGINGQSGTVGQTGTVRHAAGLGSALEYRASARSFRH